MPSFASSMFRRIKVHFSMTSVGKHHLYVLCKYDAVIKLRSLLKDLVKENRLVEVITPVGRKPQCDLVFTRASIPVREISLALVKVVYAMHDSGYSLDGSLTLRMLYWIPSTKTLKIGGLRRGDLLKWTEPRASRDFDSVDAIIRNEIFHTMKIPKELEAWLLLLKDAPVADRDLIIENMSVLDDEDKVGKFMVLFQKLQQVKGISPDIYAVALSYIVAGDFNGECMWQPYAIQSRLLEKIKNHDVPPNRFDNSVESLVVFGRHGCHHLLHGSVKIVELNHVEVVTLLIKVSEIYYHIETFLPGLFAQLQRGLHAALKLLEQQNLPLP